MTIGIIIFCQDYERGALVTGNIYAHKGIDRDEVRRLYREGYCQSAIARKFGVGLQTISYHLRDLIIPAINRSNGNKLTAAQVRRIRRLHIIHKIPCAHIARDYNVSDSAVLNVVHGVFYRWVSGEIITPEGVIEHLSGETSTSPLNTKGEKKRGHKKGAKRRPHGSLLPIARKYGVSTSTVCRWLKSGKVSMDDSVELENQRERKDG